MGENKQRHIKEHGLPVPVALMLLLLDLLNKTFTFKVWSQLLERGKALHDSSISVNDHKGVGVAFRGCQLVTGKAVAGVGED